MGRHLLCLMRRLGVLVRAPEALPDAFLATLRGRRLGGRLRAGPGSRLRRGRLRRFLLGLGGAARAFAAAPPASRPPCPRRRRGRGAARPGSLVSPRLRLNGASWPACRPPRFDQGLCLDCGRRHGCGIRGASAQARRGYRHRLPRRCTRALVGVSLSRPARCRRARSSRSPHPPPRCRRVVASSVRLRPRPRPRPPRRRRRRRASPLAPSVAGRLRSAASGGSSVPGHRLEAGSGLAPPRPGRVRQARRRPSRIAARAAAATAGGASRNPNSGLTSLAGISGALITLLAFRRPSAADAEVIFMMSMNSSATAIRSELVFGWKLITSQRTPLSWSARMAGAKSPSPDTITAMSIRSARRKRSTTSSMSRLAFTRPSPNLRMSLTTACSRSCPGSR